MKWTRKIECDADERRRRGLDRGEPLSAPVGADVNESHLSHQKKTQVVIQSESFSTKSVLGDGINPTCVG